MRFNINNEVKVRLTDAGREAHRKNYEELKTFGLERLKAAEWHNYTPPKEDADGWSRWQLWDLMRQFGPHITHGMSTPFETEIEILESEAV